MVIKNKNKNKRVIHYENFNESLEKFYFTIINILENTLGYENIDKVNESFTASINSAQWGLMEQRKSIQQDKVSAYLGTIGKLIKDMVLIYKEIKIMDERISFYEKTGFSLEKGKLIIDETIDEKNSEPSEKALKDLWISLVEGGGQNATSVYGLAQQVGFVTLPDFFFKLNPKKDSDISKLVDKIETNTQVKTVLKRKLQQYLAWKERTYAEIKTRRDFQKNYLKQHFNTIKLYYSWVKPYLDNLTKLKQQSRSSKIDLNNPNKSYQILETSESMISDIAIRCIKKSNYYGPEGGVREYGLYYPVLDVKIHYRSRPILAFQGQDNNRGAMQLGRIEVELSHKTLSYKEIEEDEKDENSKVLSELTSSIDSTLDSINKNDLLSIIEESVEEEFEPDKKSKTFTGIIDFIPFAHKLKTKNISKKSLNFDKKQQLSYYRDNESKNTKHQIIVKLIKKIYSDKKFPSISGSDIGNRNFIKNINKDLKIHSKFAVDSIIYEKNMSSDQAKNDFLELYEYIKFNYGMIRPE